MWYRMITMALSIIVIGIFVEQDILGICYSQVNIILTQSAVAVWCPYIEHSISCFWRTSYCLINLPSICFGESAHELDSAFPIDSLRSA